MAEASSIDAFLVLLLQKLRSPFPLNFLAKDDLDNVFAKRLPPVFQLSQPSLKLVNKVELNALRLENQLKTVLNPR